MEEKITCFKCKQHKSLSSFKENRREYQVKIYKGRCLVCIDCDFQRSVKDLSVIRFKIESKKFDIIKFNNELEVLHFFWEEADVYKTKRVSLIR